MKPMNFPGRKERRVMEAEWRQDNRDKRNAARQLDALDDRLGKGKGAKKERARLKAEIAKAKK